MLTVDLEAGACLAGTAGTGSGGEVYPGWDGWGSTRYMGPGRETLGILAVGPETCTYGHARWLGRPRHGTRGTLPRARVN